MTWDSRSKETGNKMSCCGGEVMKEEKGKQKVGSSFKLASNIETSTWNIYTYAMKHNQKNIIDGTLDHAILIRYCHRDNLMNQF